MNLGISTASFYPLETELALEIIGKAGVKNTELFFNARSEMKESFIDILEDIKERYGINIVSIHPTLSLAEPYMIFSAYDRRFYEALDEYSRYSEIAARLGAKFIIMHGGKLNGILSDEEYCEKYMLIKQATLKNGVTVLHENVVNFRAGNLEFMRSMREILGKDAEFCFDIKQAIRCGYEPFSIIEEFYQNIHHYHISDHSISSDCQLPFKGGFNFKKLFSFLYSTGYEGASIIEVYNNAYKDYSEITDSFEELNNILKSSNLPLE